MAGYQLETPAGHGGRLVTVIADPGPAREQAMEAVRVTGGTVAATLGWPELATADEAPTWPGIVLAEAEGVQDDMLAAALPWLAPGTGSPPASVVVTLGATQIDLVAAMLLLGAHVQLLCDASLPDRIGALALASVESGAGFADPARAAETERLRRLGDELARIADTLTTLARQKERGDGGVGDRTGAYGAAPGVTPPLATTAAEVRGAIRSRRLRDAEFAGGGWFEDPAWDMLLDLFAAELEGTQVAVSSLCIAAAVAPTTALRWITRMTEAGLLRRAPDPADRRRAFVALSDHASAAMRRYCDAIRRGGLGIA